MVFIGPIVVGDFNDFYFLCATQKTSKFQSFPKPRSFLASDLICGPQSENSLNREEGWLSISCIRPEDGELCLVLHPTWSEPRLCTFKLSEQQADWCFVSKANSRLKADTADLLWIPADWQPQTLSST
jgi:hypothetical protein